MDIFLKLLLCLRVLSVLCQMQPGEITAHLEGALQHPECGIPPRRDIILDELAREAQAITIGLPCLSALQTSLVSKGR